MDYKFYTAPQMISKFVKLTQKPCAVILRPVGKDPIENFLNPEQSHILKKDGVLFLIHDNEVELGTLSDDAMELMLSNPMEALTVITFGRNGKCGTIFDQSHNHKIICEPFSSIEQLEKIIERE